MLHLVPCQLAYSYLNFNCFFSSVYLALSSVSPPPLDWSHTCTTSTYSSNTLSHSLLNLFIAPLRVETDCKCEICEEWEERDNINWTTVTDVDCEMNEMDTQAGKGRAGCQDTQGQRTKDIGLRYRQRQVQLNYPAEQCK